MWIKNILIEFGPVVVFFVVDYYRDFMSAVFLMVVATVVSLFASMIYSRRVPLFAIVSTVAVALFGFASIYFDDPQYFIFSDTILDGIFVILLLLSLRWKKPLLQSLFESSFAITDRAWRILTWRWAGLFAVLVLLNEIIRIYGTEELWVYYKLSTVFIILAFGCYQFTLSVKERIPEESNWLGLRVREK